MIIWINGAFGAGKSQTATELHRRLPDSFLYDPENAGFFIRKNIPKEMCKPDFQDHWMWRECNFTMLKAINSIYHGIIVVPMTIVNPQFFDEIVGRLRADGIEIHHYSLMASKEVLLGRLRSRGDGKKSWGVAQIDRCMNSLSSEMFQQHLNTDAMTIEDVVERIASLCNLRLLPDRRGKIRKRFDRLITQIKQIR